MMRRLASIPTTLLLALLVAIVAVPAAAILAFSGLRMRQEAIAGGRAEIQRFVDGLAAEQQNHFAAAQQLLVALSQQTQILGHDPAIEATLSHLLQLNHQYSNIFAIDLDGEVWASGYPARPFNVADRLYFQSALRSGQLSSGEFLRSRANRKSSFNLALPIRDAGERIIGVIAVGFDLTQSRRLLGPTPAGEGGDYHLLDRSGLILVRGEGQEASYGKPFDAGAFARMRDGPDAEVFVEPGPGGGRALTAYRKLRAPGEAAPSMYVHASVPLESVLQEANRALRFNLAAFATLLLVAVALATMAGRRLIVDRLRLLEQASRRLAAGDREVRVSELVSGGELGRLGSTFDLMAATISAREQAAERSERSYREIFNATTDAILVFDADSGRLLEVNRAAEALYGCGREELLQTGAELLGAPQGGHAESGPGDLLRSAAQRGRQPTPWLAQKKGGEPFWSDVVFSISTIGGENRVLAVVRDTTARKRAEDDRDKLQGQLLQSQKMEAIGRLAGGVAHDLNNLLTVVLGHVSLLQEAVSPALAEDVQAIGAAGERAASLTRQLLAFARKQVVAPTVLDLNELILETDKMLRRLVPENIEMAIVPGAHRCQIRADRGQIEQVLLNLVVNARDAMRAGGKLVLETREVPEEARVELRVADTGQGMTPEVRERIFEPFFTTKPKGEGTGLGLSTVYGIVTQSGGQISVETEPGRGATFLLSFPLARGAVEVPPRPPEEQARGGGECILLVEDEPLVRSFAARVLRSRGFRVVEATDGVDGLEAAFRQPASLDLLITDLVMPRMGGQELAARLRGRWPGLPVLLVSGYSEAPPSSGEGMSFLPKPYRAEELVRRARQEIDAQRQRATAVAG